MSPFETPSSFAFDDEMVTIESPAMVEAYMRCEYRLEWTGDNTTIPTFFFPTTEAASKPGRYSSSAGGAISSVDPPRGRSNSLRDGMLLETPKMEACATRARPARHKRTLMVSQFVDCPLQRRVQLRWEDCHVERLGE